MAVFPPSTNIPAASCLDAQHSRSTISNEITQQIATRNQMIFPYENGLLSLPTRYPPLIIEYYNVMHQGHRQSAKLLAQQIPAGFYPKQIMDLGTGTGLTAIEVCKSVTANGAIERLVIVDGMDKMIEQCMKSIDAETRLPEALLPHISANTGDIVSRAGLSPPCIKPGQQLVQLVTAQRVLSEIAVQDHVRTLQAWMAMTGNGGKLIVDVPHPDRRIGLEWMGRNGDPRIHVGPEHEYCFQLADEQTWNECKDYARELAEHTNLSIEGTVIPQRPQTGVVDKLPMLEAWISQRRPLAMTGSLSRDEVDYFRRDYIKENKTYYKDLGYEVQYDYAAVIVVFSRRPVSAGPTAST